MRFGEGHAEVTHPVLDAHFSKCSLPGCHVDYDFGEKAMEELLVEGGWEVPEKDGLDRVVWPGICLAARVLAADRDAKALPVDGAFLLFMQGALRG